MKTQGLSLNRISTLPDDITGNILSLMPIRDALRTSILSTKWRYSWRSMPKLVFTQDMVKPPSRYGYGQLEKYKLVNAIFHVLLLHNGPTKLAFHFSLHELQMVSEFDQIISYLSRGIGVKELKFVIFKSFYQLPVSFFSLRGLERIELRKCVFEPPLTFNGFSWLKSMKFMNVKFSVQMLQRFLSKCPLLEHIGLGGCDEDSHFVTGGNKFTFVDLLQCVPLIQTLGISKYYTKYLSAGGMPHKLPTSLADLKCLYLDVCLTEQNEISSVLCILRSSLVLKKICFGMCDNEKLPVRKTPTNFLDPEDYSDLKLNNLETLDIIRFSNLPVEVEFVKLIMAKSPVLKKVRIELNVDVSVDEELEMLRNLVRHPFPRSSPSAQLIIQRPQVK